jgi:uncharacterized protein YutE (UPF0331/DUF86 family)
MVNRKIFVKKIATITNSLEFIETHCPDEYKRFASDLVLQAALLFHLEKAIQALIDLFLHIISDEGWGVVLHKAGMVDILVRKNVIDEKYREKLIRIIGFRNRLVHEYEEIDLKQTFEILRIHREDIKAVLKQVTRMNTE